MKNVVIPRQNHSTKDRLDWIYISANEPLPSYFALAHWGKLHIQHQALAGLRKQAKVS
jgi:hypothetical protein